MPDSYSTYLDFAQQVAHLAGDMMRQRQQSLRAHFKADHTVVTDIDETINSLVIQQVRQAYPDHGILAEEGSFQQTNHDWLWVCDPIDGTAAYVTHVPTSAFSLALVHKGEPVLGVIYNPWTNDIYTATVNSPAFRNGTPIQVSTRTTADHPILGAKGSGVSSDIFAVPKGIEELNRMGWGIIRFSGVAYKGGLIAQGGLDGTVYTHNGAHDVAAVQVLVTQAGGRVTDIDGLPQRYDQPINGAIISNGLIHADLVALVASLRREV